MKKFILLLFLNNNLLPKQPPNQKQTNQKTIASLIRIRKYSFKTKKKIIKFHLKK
jgi:hypothetical protein